MELRTRVQQTIVQIVPTQLNTQPHLRSQSSQSIKKRVHRTSVFLRSQRFTIVLDLATMERPKSCLASLANVYSRYHKTICTFAMFWGVQSCTGITTKREIGVAYIVYSILCSKGSSLFISFRTSPVVDAHVTCL